MNAGIIDLVLANKGWIKPDELGVPCIMHDRLLVEDTGYMISNVRVPRHFNDFLFDEFKAIKVLDDGFIKLVDSMGDQASIVQAARVSYGAGTKTVRSDEGLIKYLFKHKHTTPFEMVEYKFLVRVPMDCWRQWIRHRTASVNEYSTRYSEAIDSMTTAGGKWRKQAVGNRQGSDELITDEVTIKILNREEELVQRMCREVYEKRLACGVAREQARKDLPLSTYTEAYWKIDLKNLMNFLTLRLDEHAQYEIRLYAQAIVRLLENHVPLIMELINAVCNKTPIDPNPKGSQCQDSTT